MQLLTQYNEVVGILLIQVLITIIYITAGWYFLKGEISICGITAFVTYTTYITSPINAILNIGYMLSGVIPSAKRYYEFMELKEEIESGEINLL